MKNRAKLLVFELDVFDVSFLLFLWNKKININILDDLKYKQNQIQTSKVILILDITFWI